MVGSHKEEVNKYFSKTTRFWKGVYDERWIRNKFISYWMNERVALVMERARAYAGIRHLTVLDVGCGQGVLLKEMAACGHDTVGIDINQVMIRATRENFRNLAAGNVACLVSDGEGLPFRDDHFDLVSCVGVLQYLADDAGCLKELSRVTRPEGTIIVTLPNIHPLHSLMDPYYYFKRLPQYMKSRLSHKGRPYAGGDPSENFSYNVSFRNKHYYWGQLRPLFKKSGLKEISTDAVAFHPPTFWRKPLFTGSLSCWGSAGLRNLSKSPGFRWLAALSDRWVICLRKTESRDPIKESACKRAPRCSGRPSEETFGSSSP